MCRTGTLPDFTGVFTPPVLDNPSLDSGSGKPFNRTPDTLACVRVSVAVRHVLACLVHIETHMNPSPVIEKPTEECQLAGRDLGSTTSESNILVRNGVSHCEIKHTLDQPDITTTPDPIQRRGNQTREHGQPPGVREVELL
jgi:hypothetical protein